MSESNTAEECSRLLVLTVREASLFLRMSESKIRSLIKQRRIPYAQIDGRYIFYRPVLEEWLRQITVTPDGTSNVEAGKVIAEEIWDRRK